MSREEEKTRKEKTERGTRKGSVEGEKEGKTREERGIRCEKRGVGSKKK